MDEYQLYSLLSMQTHEFQFSWTHVNAEISLDKLEKCRQFYGVSILNPAIRSSNSSKNQMNVNDENLEQKEAKIQALKEKLIEVGKVGIELLNQNEEVKVKNSELEAGMLRLQREIIEVHQQYKKELSLMNAEHENNMNDIQNDYEMKLTKLKNKINSCSNCNPILKKVQFDSVRLEQQSELQELRHKCKLLEDDNKNLSKSLELEISRSANCSSDDLTEVSKLRSQLDQMNLNLQSALSSSREELNSESNKRDQSDLIKSLDDRISELNSEITQKNDLVEKMNKISEEQTKEIEEYKIQIDDILVNCKRTSELMMETINQNNDLLNKNKKLSMEMTRLRRS